MGIAYFDLDRTLIPENSAWGWMAFERREGRLGALQVARAAVWLTAYHLGIGALEDALRAAVREYAGQAEADVLERTTRFFEESVRGRYRPGALAALAAHRRAGEPVVLLTSSSPYLSGLVAADLALDGSLSNRYGVDGAGRLDGSLATPLCYGQGKVALAALHAAARGFGLRECTFYSDSWSDRPMLEAAGRPVAVNPDPRLRRHAARLGWPQVDWGTP